MKNDLRLSCIAALADTHLTGPDGPIPLRFVADSRLVVPGDAFVAFRGEQVNGHDFIHDAVSRGASLIICEESAGVPNHVASIVVDNCFSAIPRMARRYLEIHRESLEVLAVTGSVGKTTTREMIRTCLAPSFKVHS
ncbi:MAG TPA: Mur ligase domain-containing protein, partial [Synergistales bacterium]|nr:Mur ligase domain-containing protein [Synergistales bacterium]